MSVKLREIGSSNNNYQKFTKYRNFLQQYQRIALARDENIRIRAMFFCLRAARKEIDRGVKMTRLYKNIWQLTR